MPIGTLRRFEVVRVPLADLKEIKNSLGGTINDVVLTVTASGLRALLRVARRGTAGGRAASDGPDQRPRRE